MQIEARVDQQTEISRELSLWGQRGSRVIRGNLLAIPVSGSFIYVEPIYLEAKQEQAGPPAGAAAQPSKGFGKSRTGQGPGAARPDRSRTAALPELKRVIVAFGNRVVMEETLEQALRSALEGQEGSPTKSALPSLLKKLDQSALGARALEHYNKARDFLRQGKWAEYGKELENMENVLKQMTGTAQKHK